MIVLCLLALSADNAGTEAAVKAAVAAVAPSVVRIETSGGRGTAGAGRQAVRKGDAPTTGLVVAADGYVVTSSFNFADKPSDVFVTVPGRPRQVAKVVAADITRMLTLLKIDAADLPVPAAVPPGEVKVGAWATAVGRALAPDATGPPAVSVGVVSAVGRVWGKLLQTDAKVSPVNYGGPLVALDGRVFGVLVPASPDADGDTAGAEWYDSGIGFAVPLTDVFAVLPRLKEGKDLRRGRLGFTPKEPDQPYTAAVVVGSVSPGSPLDKAEVKPGDVITAVDGKVVSSFSRLQHAVGPKYDGDEVTLTVRRGDDSREVKLTLSALDGRQPTSTLGVLPTRDVEPGVGLRWVDPNGPAGKAGLQAGDRILKVGLGEKATAVVPGRNELAELVTASRPGTVLAIERKRGDATETVKVTLAAAVATVPDELAAFEPTGDPLAALPPGLSRRTNQTSGRKTWVYVPDTVRKDSAPGLLVWLHPAGKGGRDADEAVELWKGVAAKRGLVLVGPESANPDGWLASEADELLADVRVIARECGADPDRVAAVGVGAGGRMAYHLGFTAGDFIKGVSTVGADLGTKPRDPQPGRPLLFFLAVGENDTRRDGMTATADELQALGYVVTLRVMAGVGADTLDADTVTKLGLWLDFLDRI